jgi:apolipoprotein N-acyltransferase
MGIRRGAGVMKKTSPAVLWGMLIFALLTGWVLAALGVGRGPGLLVLAAIVVPCVLYLVPRSAIRSDANNDEDEP